MPLYEYQCERCDHRFEVIQKYSDPPLDTCPRCGGPVRKLMSSPAIQFKGSGWYITDYARKSDSGSTDGDSGAKKDDSAAKKETAEKSESGGKTVEKAGKSEPTASPKAPADPVK